MHLLCMARAALAAAEKYFLKIPNVMLIVTVLGYNDDNQTERRYADAEKQMGK